MSEVEKSLKCSWCKSGSEARFGSKKFKCPITGRFGSNQRACTCKHFISRIPIVPLEEIERHPVDNLPIRNKTLLDLRTEDQWAEVGRYVIPGKIGHEMHPTSMSKGTCTYYLEEETY